MGASSWKGYADTAKGAAMRVREIRGLQRPSPVFACFYGQGVVPANDHPSSPRKIAALLLLSLYNCVILPPCESGNMTRWCVEDAQAAGSCGWPTAKGVHSCRHCLLVLDRDANAARNNAGVLRTYSLQSLEGGRAAGPL